MILALDFDNPLARHFWRDRRPLVLACGCFDVLTLGHVRHLTAARALGACLTVLVTSDEHVNKGQSRPVFLENQRAEMVDALRCVDFTVVNLYPTAEQAIRALRPEVYAKGREYAGRSDPSLRMETAAVVEVGGRVEFVGTVEDMHTTDVLNSLLERGDEFDRNLADVRSRIRRGMRQTDGRIV